MGWFVVTQFHLYELRNSNFIGKILLHITFKLIQVIVALHFEGIIWELQFRCPCVISRLYMLIICGSISVAKGASWSFLFILEENFFAE